MTHSSTLLNVTRMQRGEHDISDELTFTNHTGYVFHDSRGFECGAKEELQIVQDFIRERSRRPTLEGRVHAIWSARFFQTFYALSNDLVVGGTVFRWTASALALISLRSMTYARIRTVRHISVCKPASHLVRKVPVIPVFTKYDAFILEVRWKLEDDKHLQGDQLLEQTLLQCEEDFKEQYLDGLRGVSRFVRLEGGFQFISLAWMF